MSLLKILSRHSTQSFFLLCLLLVTLLLACSSEPSEVVEETAVSVDDTVGDPAATQEMETESDPTPIATMSPTPEPASLENETYLVNLSSSSDRRAMADIFLTVRQVTVSDESLTFTVAFENNANQIKYISGIDLNLEDFRLLGESGTEYIATSMSDNLIELIPVDGLTPGAAVLGTVTFSALPLPEITQYNLQFAIDLEFGDISIDLMSLASTNDLPEPVKVDNGDYPIDLLVYSTDEILAPLKLHLNSVTFDDKTITFDINFTNDGFYEGYEIFPAPTGFDAWLLDGERQAYAPLEVSEELSFSITGEDGLDPNEINNGTITFPRVDGQTIRFVFNNYVPAQLTFESSGNVLSAQLTTHSGEIVASQPAPFPEEIAYAGVQESLTQYCESVVSADYTAYQELFNQSTNADYQTIFTEFTQLPIADCTFDLNPDSNTFAGADAGFVNNLTVWLELLPEGITPNNPFMIPLRMSFQKPNDEWLIDNIVYEEEPPAWSLENTVQAETEHFYVLASGELEAFLPTYVEKSEEAYQLLASQGLPVQGKYLGLFIATTAEYRRLTNVSSTGVAPLTSLPAPNDTVRNISRYFLIDIEALSEIPDGELPIIAHELVHVVMQEHGREAMPIWLIEGIAEFYSGNYKLISDQDFQRLPSMSLDSFMHGGSINPQGYAFSGMFITFLVETFGEQALLDFFYAYSQLPASETESQQQIESVTEALTAEHFGSSIMDLDNSFHNWLATYQR